MSAIELTQSLISKLNRWGFKLTKNEATQLAELSEDVDVQTRAPTNEDKVKLRLCYAHVRN